MKSAPSSNRSTGNHSPRLVTLGLLAWLILQAATGCKHESNHPAATDFAGVYTLISVDGKSVPCNLTHEGVTMTVKSGAFTINTNGTCRSQTVFAVSPHPDVHREVKATYTLQDTELTMRWEGAGITKGHINGNAFTMNNEGMIFIYRK